MDFEESLRIKNNWIDGLDITIERKEVGDWLGKRINELGQKKKPKYY